MILENALLSVGQINYLAKAVIMCQGIIRARILREHN